MQMRFAAKDHHQSQRASQSASDRQSADQSFNPTGMEGVVEGRGLD
jgi:hypothetical protein